MPPRGSATPRRSGELFVDVTNPGRGRGADGRRRPSSLEETETAPTVEDALAQASLLINGGGLDQLQTITEELNTALGGNEDDVRLLLNQAATFLTQANATTSSIDAVLTSLNSSGGHAERPGGRHQPGDEGDPTGRRRPAAGDPGAHGAAEGGPAVRRGRQSTVNATRSQLFALLAETEPVLAELASNRGRFGT